MSDSDLLSQDEIDALLDGVDSGEVNTEEAGPEPDQVQSFDFTSQDRIVRGRLPTLEMINERFTRHYRISLFNMLRRSANLVAKGVEMLKFSDYMQTMHMPTSMNLIKIKPMRGTALVVFEPKLVYTVVDNFFGGNGRFPAKIEDREFTPTELRVIQMMLDHAFEDLQEAWQPVLPLEFEFINHEVNPQFANIVSPSEHVVISRFGIELEGGSGELHITIPYSMIEPIRDQLDAGIQSDRMDRDERWTVSLREQIQDAPVELSSVFTSIQIPLRRLSTLKAGDILPIEMPKSLDLCVEDVPVFRGRVGVHDGHNAVKITEVIHRNNTGQRQGQN